ncbi:hypothetical protein FIM12_01135 [SAR202 cluster bacterium AD-804-J14_MRT_500m]|nr:hypothetical protein [SAR202 cluster bacterium AD-804-J14_MRT_500m]
MIPSFLGLLGPIKLFGLPLTYTYVCSIFYILDYLFVKRPQVLVGCVLIPHFVVTAESLRNPETSTQGLIVMQSNGSRRTVCDSSPTLTGIRPGMRLQEAVSFAKDVRLLELDTPYIERLFEDILSALELVSPVVETPDLGCAYIDLHGLERLYGSDVRIAQAIQHATPETWKAQVGIGNSKFTAHMSALLAEPGRPCKAPEDSSFLKLLSVDHLPVSYKTRVQLHCFGLHTLGDTELLDVTSLQAQFGWEGKLIWELSRGIDVRNVTARNPKEEVTERLIFPEPAATLERIMLGVRILVERALSNSDLRGRRARLAILEGYASRGAPWRHRLSSKEPFNQQKIISRINASIEGTKVSAPVEELCLSLSEFTGERGRQENIFSEAQDREQIKEAIKQLHTLMGNPAPIFHVKEVEPWSRIPERRHALVQYVS